MMKDIRLRFFYKLYSNKKLLFEGYILHEDAWNLKDKFPKFSSSYINKVKKTTDTSFEEFIKALK